MLFPNINGAHVASPALAKIDAAATVHTDGHKSYNKTKIRNTVLGTDW